MQRDTHRHGEREAERDTERDTRRHTERHFCVTGQCTNACRHDHATRRPRPQCGGGERACRGQHPNYATGTCTHHDPGRHERTRSAKLGRHIETHRDTDRHRHTHTLVVDARYVAVLPISRDDHTGPDEADYATQPSSLPGGGPAAGNSAWGPLRSAREPGISHAATSRDPAPSWVPVVIVQPRRSPVNAGFFTDRHTVHTHTHSLLLLFSTSRYYQFPATTSEGPPEQTITFGSHPEIRRFPRRGQPTGSGHCNATPCCTRSSDSQTLSRIETALPATTPTEIGDFPNRPWTPGD